MVRTESKKKSTVRRKEPKGNRASTKKDNPWDLTMWNLLTACLYWHELPLDSTREDLLNFDKQRLRPRSRLCQALLGHDGPSVGYNKNLSKMRRALKMEEMFLEKKKKGLVHCYEGNGMVFVTPDEFTRFAYAQKKWLTERNKRDLMTASEAVQFKITDIIARKHRPPSLRSMINDLVFTKTKPQAKNFARKRHKSQVVEYARRIVFDAVEKTGVAMTPTMVFNLKEFKPILKELLDWENPDPKKVVRYSKRQICRWLAEVVPQSKNGSPRKDKKVPK